MYCSKCGTFSDGDFCPACGARITPIPSSAPEKKETNQGEDFITTVKNSKKKFDRFIGADENIQIKVTDLFSGIFKKHTKEELDEVLIRGTSKTTPAESDISAGWTPPWAFSRVFLVLTATFLALYICVFSFGNTISIAGMIFIGSLALPFALLLFFWEANVPRNMSFFDIMRIFFIGGTLSLVVTMIMFEITGASGELDFGGAILVGIVEELSKFVICLLYIKKFNTKYIMNGLLIGAAVGTGFAVFESAGYAFMYTISDSVRAGVDVIFLRAFLSGGGHIVWAAITSAAFVLVKRDKPFSLNYLGSYKFLTLFFIPVVLHAVWDMPINFLNNIYFVQITLTALAWVVVLSLLRSGLSQINKLKSAQAAAVTQEAPQEKVDNPAEDAPQN